MKKHIILGICIMTGMMGNVFAHDCGLIQGKNAEGIIKSYTDNFSKYHTTITPTDFNTAIMHLKAYCCISTIICNDDEKKNLPKEQYYPSSAYLFDHLLDITMRKLDGIQTLAYGLEVDPLAKERRTYITETAKDENGIKANIVQETFTGYRSLHTKNTKNIDEVIKNFNTTDKNKLSLADKYNKTCEITKKIYKDIQKETTIIIGDNFLSSCKNIVQNRVQREITYVKLIIIQKSTQLFDETTKAYTKKHFVEEKLMELQNIINKVKDIFQTIVQQAPASKTCSK